MKRYYIHYYRDFGNTYNLYWADDEHTEAIPSDFERISRKEALSMAHAESKRREYDQAFSGYADSAIYPIDYVADVEGEGFYRGIALEPGTDPRIMEYVNRDKYIEALQQYKKREAQWN